MNLLDQFDAMRMDSEEDNSEQEDMNNKNSGEQKLVVNFDLNYDIRGAKDARADILDRLAIGAANSEESGSHLQFDHQNSDADSYRDMEAAEKEHMAMLKRDSDLLDDKDILEMQAAQSILESCGLGSSGTSKQHNFRPSGMSLGFDEAIGDSQSDADQNASSSEKQIVIDDDNQDSVKSVKEEEK